MIVHCVPVPGTMTGVVRDFTVFGCCGHGEFCDWDQFIGRRVIKESMETDAASPPLVDTAVDAPFTTGVSPSLAVPLCGRQPAREK